MPANALKTPPKGIILKLYRTPLRLLLGRMILLLTTTGRKSGLPRVTPLQYELVEGAYCVGARRGQQADWFKNILANPHVELQVRSRRLKAIAEPVTDPARIADFLALRLRRHPLIVGQILHMDGLSRTPTRDELLRYAGRLAMVILHPQP
jgi:deazaflavin-dependent oxidoreductase (nitroreductase family)